MSLSRLSVGGNEGLSLRILTSAAPWQGANDYAFVRAFRRMGHSVRNLPETESFPLWEAKPLRVIRRVLMERIVADYNAGLLREARAFRPDLFFVFKGPLIKAETLRSIREMGALLIQFYPDVSFHTHGPYLPQALREYDWVFTTKSFGLGDMKDQLGITNSSFVPHAFDPETHRAHLITDKDREQYSCDVSFIGNWSKKKEEIVSNVASALPKIDLRIWGPKSWACMRERYQGQPVFGQEYAKAIALSRINLGLLSEQRTGASNGDLTTARTFEIPSSGGFMLHERTDEVLNFFEEEREFACFSTPQEMADKVSYYLDHEEERIAIAVAGSARCFASGYSIKDRAATVISKYFEILREGNTGDVLGEYCG